MLIDKGLIKGKLRQGEFLNVGINFVGSILKAMQTARKATNDRTFFVQLGFNEAGMLKVQFNADLLKCKAEYLCVKIMALYQI